MTPTLLAPLLLLLAALPLMGRPGPRPGRLPLVAEGAALGALALSLAGLLGFILNGATALTLAPGLALRLDLVSAVMVTLVGFIGWVVVRYARSYLDGAAREGRFHALMLATLAAVLVFVQAGSLPLLLAASVAIGLLLRQLLLFYPERAQAQRAAAKFTLVWGAGDVALLLATFAFAAAFGTTDIAAIASAASTGLPTAGVIAVALTVLAALIKTAAFPLHGWLTEVMEAPTPVSALLHAGIINAGGVILLKLAEAVQASPGAMAALVMAGGLTALFGALVMLTQSAVKTALAWSTVAQMGFLMLQCGLGLWPLALLHIVAHSLYKAHAFLSSGGAVQAVQAIRKPGPVAVPGLAAVGRAFLLALVIYGAVALGFSALIGGKSAQALALGAILIFGVAYLIAQGMADAAPRDLTQRTALASVAAAVSYFTFHALSTWAASGALPPPPEPGALEWGLIVLALLSFAMVAVAQALFPLWAHHPSTAGLRVHLANGLYLNAVLDRLIGGFRTASAASTPSQKS
jgi:NADH:ubiquinone oxidoreductase subunit 5 (subunit L)/multisubunit Na+/H+ antiporter MnhA subunit